MVKFRKKWCLISIITPHLPHICFNQFSWLEIKVFPLNELQNFKIRFFDIVKIIINNFFLSVDLIDV